MPDSSSAIPDVGTLTRALEALATPARLVLLQELRTPRTLKEIKVRLPDATDGRERLLARQTVKVHLDRLVGIGVVAAREAERDYGPTMEYVVNHQALFAMAESFRSLARLRPDEAPDGATLHGGRPGHPLSFRGPSLVLVHGLDEGRTYDLTPAPRGTKEWVIGRRPGLAVSLDFDPFISTENSRIVYAEGAHFIEDLPVSTNGTHLNFQPLPKGGRSALRTGDLVGVGRCLLMYRA